MADTPPRGDTPPPDKPETPKPTPEFQQKLDAFRAQKEARQNAGQAAEPRGEHFRLYHDGPQYPAADGALGHMWETPTTRAESARMLPPGTQIDRYGAPQGSYYARAGTPAADRALPPGMNTENISARYEIVRPLPEGSFSQSVTASYYHKRDGGGMQYHFHTPLSQLEQGGYVRAIKGPLPT